MGYMYKEPVAPPGDFERCILVLSANQFSHFT